MADVIPVRNNIPIPAVQFLAAVSENLAQTLAAESNFINYFQLDEKRFVCNGNYGGAVTPFLAVDGISPFEFNSQIIDAWLVIRTAGTAGSTSIDVQLATTPGGSFTSIFTTIPSISWQAGDYTWVGSVNPSLVGPQYNPMPAYSAPANTTAGILNTTITNAIPAWSAIRADLISVQTGNPFTCEMVVRYRPI